MKDQKPREALFDAFGHLPDHVLDEASNYQKAPKRGYYIRRTATSLIAAVLCIALVTVTVMAAVPALRRYLNLNFVSESTRQTAVPEGWIGVYTVEDLDNVRNGLDGKYILMNDLTFPENAGSFAPIGSKDAPFTGQFDGNGHVISGLIIDVTGAEPVLTASQTSPDSEHYFLDEEQRTYAGLFGYCAETWPEDEITVEGDVVSHSAHLMEVMDTSYGGLIKNLGVENATLRVSDALLTEAGIIAGHATYVTSCYAQSCTVEIVGFTSETNPTAPALCGEMHGQIVVGGLVGRCMLMDSCYAVQNRLSISGLSILPDAEAEGDVIMSYAGNLCGHAYTAVTSYTSDCTLTITDDCRGRLHGAELCGHLSLVPHLMTSEQYRYLTGRLLEMYDGDADNFYYKQFCSYFVYKKLSDYTGNHYYYNPTFFIGDFDHTNPVYIFDPTATFREELMREQSILKVMTAEEAFGLYTSENFKVGMLACYVLTHGASYKEASFAEFNFDTIWQMKDGRPVLRIFG